MVENSITCRITDAMNTYNPALAIVKSKGYKLFLLPDEREGYLGDYWAIKENRDFIASDPLRLLGLITLWETFGDDWREQAKQLNNTDIMDEISTRAFPKDITDIEKLSEEEFSTTVAEYRLFLDRIFAQKILSEKPSRKEFFDIINNFYKEAFLT